jgi:nitrate reductase NapAB chaperone NapD
MPISGLVVVCRQAAAADVLRALRCRAGVTVGPIDTPERIPVILETETDRSHRVSLRELRELPGVANIELAYVDYRDDPTTQAEGVSEHAR